ncbi:MAG: alkaline phosphatase, partial [Ralstonia sp.]|nr:alkaline phosphatase [Ralstonia sp.]
MHNHKLTKYAAAVAAALAMAACGSDGTSSNAGTAAPDAGTPTTPAKNVVFFLGDGMGMTTMTAA